MLAGLLMALTYIGGETAQISMSLPSAATAVFQGLFLFFLLACDVLVNYRLRWKWRVGNGERGVGDTATTLHSLLPIPHSRAAGE